MHRWVRAVLLYVHTHCIGTYNSIALTARHDPIPVFFSLKIDFVYHCCCRGPAWLIGKVYYM